MAIEAKNDTVVYTDEAGSRRGASVMAVVNADGSGLASKQRYTLLTNATATGAQVGPIAGGDYVWRAESSGWNGATATLQFLGLDGTTWYPVKDGSNADVTLTTNGSKSIGISQGSMLRVAISAAVPSAGVNSAIGGL